MLCRMKVRMNLSKWKTQLLKDCWHCAKRVKGARVAPFSQLYKHVGALFDAFLTVKTKLRRIKDGNGNYCKDGR